MPPDRVATLIRVLNELEYLQSTDFLWDFYLQTDHEATHPELLEVLLDILTKFGRVEVLEDIHTHFTISKHANIRNAAARSMGFFKDDSSIPFLKWLLNDPDFMVRFEAARSISKFDNVDLKKIKPPNLTQKEWSWGLSDFSVLIPDRSNQPEFLSVIFECGYLLGVIMSVLAVLIEELTFRRYDRIRDVAILVGYAFIENFGYRQIHAWWRFRGLIGYLKGNVEWGEMKRAGFAR